MSVQLVQQAYRFALEPTAAQERAFASHAGAARFAYNWGISTIAAALDARTAEKEAQGVATTKVPGHFDLCKMWTAHKDAHREVPDDRGRTLEWVGENFVGTYQAALRDADGAWKKFFDSRTGKRAGRVMGRPRFKSRHRSPAKFQLHGESLYLVDGSHIRLPKIGEVKIPGKVRVGTFVDRNARTARKLWRLVRKGAVAGPAECPTCHGTGLVLSKNKAKPGPVRCAGCRGHAKVERARIIRATLSRGASGTWWCSVTAEILRKLPNAPSRRQRANGTVGLDLGTRWLAVDSDGALHENPRHLDTALGQLRTAQKALSRCQRDSKRRERARRRVGTLHEQVAMQRKDATDRLTTRLARAYAGVAVEGWDAQKLAELGDPDAPAKLRRRRNRQLADAAPGMLRWQLEYKTSRTGATFTKVDRYQGTGRTCSSCWTVKDKPVPLDAEDFRCRSCGAALDRRVNTARVVKAVAAGRKLAAVSTVADKPRGEDVRPKTPSGRGGRSSSKRAARARPKGRGKTGTPDP